MRLVRNTQEETGLVVERVVWLLILHFRERARLHFRLRHLVQPSLGGSLSRADRRRSNAERVFNATDADVFDLLVAARYWTLAATVNLLVEAAQNAVALAEMIAAAGHRLFAAHEAALVPDR